MYYIKKPIPVLAFDFSQTKIDNKGKNLYDGIDENGVYYINTLEGKHNIRQDDFVIIGVRGEKYPIKREIFFETYKVAPHNQTNQQN